MNIYTNNNITRNYGRNIRQASQALSSLNTPLLNNSVKSNQNDKFENKNKKNFFQNIKDNIKDATIIIVAQRVNTIQNADKIIVLNDGKVVGQGTHDQLLQDCPEYKEIVESQTKQNRVKGVE